MVTAEDLMTKLNEYGLELTKIENNPANLGKSAAHCLAEIVNDLVNPPAHGLESNSGGMESQDAKDSD